MNVFFCFVILRLRDINEESAGQQQPRRRSNSLPIPKIEVSFYQSNDNNKKTDNNNKDFIEVPEINDVSLLAGNNAKKGVFDFRFFIVTNYLIISL